MVYIVEPHSDEALAVLQNLASLNLLTLKPLNGDAPSPNSPGIPASASSQEIQQAKDDVRRIAENQSKPAKSLAQRQLEFQKIRQAQRAAKPKTKRQWAGMINPETAEKMLLHIEKVRNEWERDL